ncbi:MAG: protein containing Six-hairpin glycosidase-like domain protein [Candidatus Gastranaerophilaceae bacterium]
MDFTIENNKEREFYAKTYPEMEKLLEKIRKSLSDGSKIDVKGLNLTGVLDYRPDFTFLYITIFQSGLKPVRWGACKKTLNLTLNRNIEQIRANKLFPLFEINNPSQCRIMIEYLTEQVPARIEEIKAATFCDKRFEPGVTGIKLLLNQSTYVYMPTDAWVESQMTLKAALNNILRKTFIKEVSNKISERIEYLKTQNYECYIVKSRTFITYKDTVIPLYRGNVLNEYSPEIVRDYALAGADWIVKYAQPNGQFLYYYDAKEDNFVDHEHPKAPADRLYYNDLRHNGGVITLIRAYQLTKDTKYLEYAKRGIDYITTVTQDLENDCAFVYYNKKGKLGGTGLALIAMMKYRNETNDKSYDEYIRKYAKHLMSRIYKTGEMLGYYIHPQVQNGAPLIEMSDDERKQTFSFYYPGEALLGLALTYNYFKEDKDLTEAIREKSMFALDWLVDERPKIYSEFFTALPSDAWLMQAIEEFCSNKEFQKENYINFVFNDVKTMMNKTYKKDDSPFIDYEGSFYYNYGDHYYPDGSRSEGVIAAYYLAKKIGQEEFAAEILETCRKNAKSQLILHNSEINNFAHLNQEKSVGAIRFKATRQWIRVDSIQHVACFFFRLYFAEKDIVVK